MNFKLNGETFTKKINPTHERIINLLSKLPDGDLLSTAKLAELINSSYNLIKSNTAREPALVPYRCQLDGNKVYWGNPRTIKEFKKANG